MTPSAKRFILEQLETHRNMSLATVRPDGYPQATAFVRVEPKVVSMLDYRRGFGWTKQVRARSLKA
jgi:hypothetical protein